VHLPPGTESTTFHMHGGGLIAGQIANDPASHGKSRVDQGILRIPSQPISRSKDEEAVFRHGPGNRSRPVSATPSAPSRPSQARKKWQNERAAGRALERALDLAEPDGALLWFLLHPVPALLERQAQHRPAHAALIAEILRLLAGNRPAPRHGARARRVGK
jgi:hypothetical protein